MSEDARNQENGCLSHAPLRWLALGLLIAGGVAIGIWLWRSGGFALFGDQERLRALLLSWGPWAPLGFILLNVVQVVLAPVPGQAVNLVSGYLFGPWLGTLYSLIGLLLGSLIVLLLVRRFGRLIVARLAGEGQLERFDRLIGDRGPLFLFLLFLMPFMPDDLANMAAGLTAMPIPQILLLQVLGRTPGIFVANWVGFQARDLALWQWLVFGGAILIMALLFWRYQDRFEELSARWVDWIAGWRDGSGAEDDD